MSSNSLISIATFSGSSTYATSFQQVLTRAVQIASLPGELVQGSMNALAAQQQATTGLLTTFAQLQGAIQNVDAASSGNIGATVSDSSILTAATTSDATPGTYTVTISSPGFQPQTRTGVVVTVQTVTRVDSVLTVGEVKENVTVSAEGAVLQTDRADVRFEIGEQRARRAVEHPDAR